MQPLPLLSKFNAYKLIIFIIIVSFFSIPAFSYPKYFKIKGKHLFYSFKSGSITSNSQVTITYGMIAIAAQSLKLNTNHHLMILSGNIVVIDTDGQIFQTDRIMLDCKNGIGKMIKDKTIKYFKIKEKIVITSKPKYLPSFADRNFEKVEDIIKTPLYLDCIKIYYYPDRELKFRKLQFYFEGENSGSFPRLSRKIGHLPPLPGIMLQKLGLRSSYGLETEVDLNYLMSDNNYGNFLIGGSNLSLDNQNKREPIGELGLIHHFITEGSNLDLQCHFKTDDEIFQSLLWNSLIGKNNKYTLDVKYQQFSQEDERKSLSFNQFLNWQNRHLFSLLAIYDMNNEWSSSFSMKNTLLKTFNSEVNVQYFSLGNSEMESEHSRTKGEFKLGWTPKYLQSNFLISRESFYPDSFSTEEAQLNFNLKPFQAPEKVFSITLMNSMNVKRLIREQNTRELVSNTSTLSLLPMTVALTSKTFLDLDSNFVWQWEKRIQQESFLNVNSMFSHYFNEYIVSGLRYSFITRRDTESPWLIKGNQNQTGSYFIVLGKEKKFLFKGQCDYDFTNVEWLSVTSSSYFFWGAYLKFEINAEYSFITNKWSKTDLVVERNLHFATLRAVWRQTTESFYIEYYAKL